MGIGVDCTAVLKSYKKHTYKFGEGTAQCHCQKIYFTHASEYCTMIRRVISAITHSELEHMIANATCIRLWSHSFERTGQKVCLGTDPALFFFKVSRILDPFKEDFVSFVGDFRTTFHFLLFSLFLACYNTIIITAHFDQYRPEISGLKGCLGSRRR